MGSSSPDRKGRTAESPAAKKNPTKLKAEVKKSLIASQFTSGFEFLPEGAIDKLFTNGKYVKQFQCPQYVAVKELRDAGDRQKLFRSWEKEADILRKMNKLEQLHIVRFFTAFKRGIPGNESHYLMFECVLSKRSQDTAQYEVIW
ncbi:hypothetical protein COL940_010180 [Colletotrichum noveboracense]|nr:hypothetical protein COL940_010180 [Colletotrichum noveboracense]